MGSQKFGSGVTKGIRNIGKSHFVRVNGACHNFSGYCPNELPRLFGDAGLAAGHQGKRIFKHRRLITCIAHDGSRYPCFA
jgi:hypothetical protein